MLDFSLDNNTANSLTIDNDLEFVIQQIELLFSTDIHEVLGDDEYGSKYDEYLYSLNLSNAGLEQKIQDDLDALDTRGFFTRVSVHIVEGTVRDIAFIDIFIFDESNRTDIVKSYIIN